MELRPVTVLIGKNSSGKSSLTKLVASILKGVSGKYASFQLPMEIYPNLILGTGFSALCRNGNNVGLHIGGKFSDNLEMDYELFDPKLSDAVAIREVTIKNGSDRVITGRMRVSSNGKMGNSIGVNDFNGLIPEKILKEEELGLEFQSKFDYLGPLRTDVPRSIPSLTPESLETVGPRGENAYRLLCTDQELFEKVRDWFVDNMKISDMRAKPMESGEYIIQLQKKENNVDDSSRSGAGLASTRNAYWVNLADEGMGFGQILPIVTRAMMNVAGSTVIVEQPELHLHPAAHASVAQLFAESAKTTDQRFLVESHSENFLLGLREAVVDKDNPLKPEDVVIYFIDDNGDDFSSGAYLKKIEIDENGDLSSWPAEVFDEDFNLLMEIQRKAEERGES